MARALNITGVYPPDWKEISDRTWAEAGNLVNETNETFRSEYF